MQTRIPGVALVLALVLPVGTAALGLRQLTAAAPPPCTPRDASAAILLRVRDAATGRPVPDAWLHARPFAMGGSDSTGHACLDDVAPGTVAVTVERLGFHAESVTVQAAARRTTEGAVHLRRMSPPCCTLGGAWELRLDMDRPARLHPEPATRSTSGLVVFSSRLPYPREHSWPALDTITGIRWETAQSLVDLTPFFGGPAAPDVSTTVFGGGGALLFRELIGMVVSGDSVTLTLIPRMTHGGLSLQGRLVGDTIRGTWVQNAYCCGAEGRFVMTRAAATPATDALVGDAVREYDRLRAEAARASEEADARMGHIRLRVYDEATQRYIEAGAMLELTAADPDSSGYTFHFSAADGWGGAMPAEPGRYRLWLFMFPCGSGTFGVDPDYAMARMPRLEFTLRPCERVDQPSVSARPGRAGATGSRRPPESSRSRSSVGDRAAARGG